MHIVALGFMWPNDASLNRLRGLIATNDEAPHGCENKVCEGFWGVMYFKTHFTMGGYLFAFSVFVFMSRSL